MHLYKRADGRSPFWQYDIVSGGRRTRCSTGTTDRARAMRVMREALIAAETAPRTLTLADALDAYVQNLQADGKAWAREAAGLRNKTLGLGSFSGTGRFHLPPEMPVTGLTAPHLLKLRQARRDEGNSLQTTAHELKVLRAALFHARDRGFIVPSLRWKVPAAPAKTRYLSMAEWDAVYAALDPDRLIPTRAKKNGERGESMEPHAALHVERVQARDLFVALTLCGGRWGEVTRLTVDQVSPDGLRLFGYKTGRERVVPCPPQMLETLTRRRAVAEAAGTHYLFPAAEGSKKGHQTTSGAIRRAFDRAGLNLLHLVERHGKATIHSLRHTYASWLLQDGLTLAEVQDLLGHTTITLTMRYAHLATGSTLAKAHGSLSRMMDGRLPVFVAPSSDATNLVRLDEVRARPQTSETCFRVV